MTKKQARLLKQREKATRARMAAAGERIGRHANKGALIGGAVGATGGAMALGPSIRKQYGSMQGFPAGAVIGGASGAAAGAGIGMATGAARELLRKPKNKGKKRKDEDMEDHTTTIQDSIDYLLDNPYADVNDEVDALIEVGAGIGKMSRLAGKGSISKVGAAKHRVKQALRAARAADVARKARGGKLLRAATVHVGTSGKASKGASNVRKNLTSFKKNASAAAARIRKGRQTVTRL